MMIGRKANLSFLMHLAHIAERIENVSAYEFGQ